MVHWLDGGTEWGRQARGQTFERQWRALARADPGGSLSSLKLDPVRWSPGLWCYVVVVAGGVGVRLFVMGGPCLLL